MKKSKNHRFFNFRAFFYRCFLPDDFRANADAAQTHDLQTDTADFGVGGTFAIIGAPNGSISIESWQKKEVEITAEIEVQAANEADLAALAAISGYTLDSSLGRVSIVSVGNFDKEYMKRTAKKIPEKSAFDAVSD